MKITDITGTSVDIQYKPAWQHDKRFYIKTDIQTNVIVQIQTDEGLVGIGEAAHSPGIYGETAQSTLGAMEMFKPYLIGEDPRQIAKLNMLMDRLSPIGNIAAKAGIDIALHDVTAKALNVPVYQLLGGLVHEKLKTHISPAITEDTAKDIVEFMTQGYTIFKVKMSGDVTFDLNMIREMLAVVDENILLSLDANQGWSVPDAKRIARIIEEEPDYKHNVILEQPVKASDFRGLAEVKNSTVLQVMADDAIRTAEDLWWIIEERAADIVSLKISRVGGIQKTQQMIQMAEAVNLPYIVDEINEMRIANTAVAHLALASKYPLYCGVTCHFLLERDIVEDGGVKARKRSRDFIRTARVRY